MTHKNQYGNGNKKKIIYVRSNFYFYVDPEWSHRTRIFYRPLAEAPDVSADISFFFFIPPDLYPNITFTSVLDLVLEIRISLQRNTSQCNANIAVSFSLH